MVGWCYLSPDDWPPEEDYEDCREPDYDPPDDWPDDDASDKAQNEYESGLRR